MKKKIIGSLILGTLVVGTVALISFGNKTEDKQVKKVEIKVDKNTNKISSLSDNMQELYINGKPVKVEVNQKDERFQIKYNGKKYVLTRFQYDMLKDPFNKMEFNEDPEKNIKRAPTSLLSKDIISYYKHDDHWHVFTKDGEFITYEDPSKFVNTKSFSENSIRTINIKELSNRKISRYYKHDDHWHIFTKDGKEYITYDNPVGKETLEEVNIDNNVTLVDTSELEKIQKDEAVYIVKIVKHYDHWHVHTSDGKEYITREDPTNKHNIDDISEKEIAETITNIGPFDEVIDHNDHVHVKFKGKSYTISKKLYEKALKENSFNPDDIEDHVVDYTNAKEIVFVNEEVFVIGHGDHGHEFPLSSLGLAKKPDTYILNNNDIIGYTSKGYYVKAPSKNSAGADIFVIYFQEGVPKGKIAKIPTYLTWNTSEQALEKIIEAKKAEIKETYTGENVDEKIATAITFNKEETIKNLNELLEDLFEIPEDEKLIKNIDNFSGDKNDFVMKLKAIQEIVGKYPNLYSYKLKLIRFEEGVYYDGVDKNDVIKLNKIIDEINHFYYVNKEQIEKNTSIDGNSRERESNEISTVLKVVNEMIAFVDKVDHTDGSKVNAIIFGIDESNRHVVFYSELLKLKNQILAGEIKSVDNEKVVNVVNEYNEKIEKYGPLQDSILSLKLKIKEKEPKISLKDYYSLIQEINDIYSEASGQKILEEGKVEELKARVSALEEKLNSVKEKEVEKDSKKPEKPKPEQPDEDPWNTGYTDEKPKPEQPDEDPWNTGYTDEKPKPEQPDEDPWNTGY